MTLEDGVNVYHVHNAHHYDCDSDVVWVAINSPVLEYHHDVCDLVVVKPESQTLPSTRYSFRGSHPLELELKLEPILMGQW
jgi:hypothetical protein